jgi:sigma-B regulation protein RsbU (phosphoserine phosphatase)
MQTDPSARPRILVADDQSAVLESLRLLLAPAGFDLEFAMRTEDVIKAVQHHQYDLVLMDMNYRVDTTSGREGLDLLPRIKAIDADLPVVVMTGWSTVDLAVETMREHAADFVQKPWENSHLLAVAQREVARGRAMRAERQQHVRELDDARLIQRRLLPEVMPTIVGWEIAVAWRPAGDVGGDYFDGIALGDKRLGICIGDVMGKGIPAALLMSSLQASVRALASEETQPADLCARLNRILCGSMSEGRFVTFFYGIIDTETGTLTYANAGHNPPFVMRRNGSTERLSEGGVVLGPFPNAKYTQVVRRLEAEDRIVMFTDGITEARTAAGDEFGEQGLAAALRDCKNQSACELKDAILGALANTCSSVLEDDATLMVLAQREPPELNVR